MASCFIDPEIGGVGGNVMVRNANQNHLCEMQALQYNMAFQISKTGETFSGSVNCISGAIFMVRKTIYDQIAAEIDDRKWLGMEVKEGEDRYMTNLILNLGFKTVVNNRAKVFTDAPSTFKAFFSQQLRWRRGFFRTFLWLLKPSIFKKKSKTSTTLSFIRLYSTAALALLIPMLITWVLIVHGLVALVILKLYMMMLVCALSMTSYIIARRIGNPIKLSAIPFLILPLWTMVDLTFLTALAGLTLSSSNWETRASTS
jgi:cellulose synthase/poly-beta-1,6-N-acetylglucosamine synthase-like glycosyltransferase